MTDYVPLIARAVAGLDQSTGASRRALYERARTALVDQLRGLDPPLTESEITRERLALEEAIRKVEAEAARQPRVELFRSTPVIRPKPPEPPSDGEPPPARRGPLAHERAPETPPPNPPEPEPDPWDEGDAPQITAEPRVQDRERSPVASAEVLKGFRALVAEVEDFDSASEAAARSGNSSSRADPREILQARPKPMRQPVNFEPPAKRSRTPRPRAEAANPPVQQRLRQTRRPSSGNPAAPFDRDHPVAFDAEELWPTAPESTPWPDEPSGRTDHHRPVPPRPLGPRRTADAGSRKTAGRWRKALIPALIGVVVLGAAAAAFWKRDTLRALFVRSPGTQAQRDVTPARPKISDRVGQGGQQGSSATGPGATLSPGAAVAQQVVLYEEDPADSQGKRYVGSVTWRTETVSSGPGQAPDLAVKADLEIPDRRISMTMSIRRNTDKALPATHTIEIVFNLPADFPFGGISNVPGILMKQAEQTRGAPLAGLAVKVTSGFFLVGLSSGDSETRRNLDLLKDRAWFDIPIVYNNGRRAILAVEKGIPGERAFKEAFAAWGE